MRLYILGFNLIEILIPKRINFLYMIRKLVKVAAWEKRHFFSTKIIKNSSIVYILFYCLINLQSNFNKKFQFIFLTKDK